MIGGRVYLSIPLYPLLSTGSTQEDLARQSQLYALMFLYLDTLVL